MLKQIAGAALGSKLATKVPKIGGSTGAAIGAAVPFIISRMSIPAMIAVGAGGYFAKKYFDKRSDKQAKAGLAEVPDTKTGTIINPPPAQAT